LEKNSEFANKTCTCNLMNFYCLSTVQMVYSQSQSSHIDSGLTYPSLMEHVLK